MSTDNQPPPLPARLRRPFSRSINRSAADDFSLSPTLSPVSARGEFRDFLSATSSVRSKSIASTRLDLRERQRKKTFARRMRECVLNLALRFRSRSDDVAGSASDNVANSRRRRSELENYSRIKARVERQRGGRGRPRALSLCYILLIFVRSPFGRVLSAAPRTIERDRSIDSTPASPSRIASCVQRPPLRRGIINAASPKNDYRLHASLMSTSNGLHCATDYDGGGEGGGGKGGLPRAVSSN